MDSEQKMLSVTWEEAKGQVCVCGAQAHISITSCKDLQSTSMEKCLPEGEPLHPTLQTGESSLKAQHREWVSCFLPEKFQRLKILILMPDWGLKARRVILLYC